MHIFFAPKFVEDYIISLLKWSDFCEVLLTLYINVIKLITISIFAFA